MHWLLRISLALLLTAECCAHAAWAADPASSLESLDRHYAQQLAVLAEKCDSLNLPAEAMATKAWQIKRTPGRANLFVPLASEPKPPAAASDLVARWQAKFRELRNAQADSLSNVAREFLDAGDAARAYQLWHEVLRENPDHATIRRALGYVPAKNGTEWSIGAPPPQASSGKANQPKTGWQAGRYWRVETPHWRIATNHSAAAGIDLAKRLTEFQLLWQQTFFDYWCSEDQLRAAVERGDKLPTPRLPMNVLLFKNREEYLKYLPKDLPNTHLTQGIYLDEQETAVFYMADDSVHATWHHEATHQLFQQWYGSPAGVGSKQNFWIVEGAAMYVESLTNHGVYWTIGGWQADRLQFARYRALAGDFKPPLADVVALGRDGVQADPNIRKLYPFFAAASHLLFDHPDPMFRRAGCALLKQVYQQNDEINSLALLTKQSLGELDAQLLKSLQVTDEDMLQTPGISKLRNLSLGRTQVTNKGLAPLAECHGLRWLDLTGLTVTDDGFGQLPVLPKLEQLFLEATGLTDKSVPGIGRSTNLEELDLSRLPITDESIPALGKLKKLKVLYLTGSQLTPAGFSRLKALLPKTSLEQ